VRKFETAVRSLQTIQEVLQTSMERVRLMGEQLIRT
jgi:hypothetical protein